MALPEGFAAAQQFPKVAGRLGMHMHFYSLLKPQADGEQYGLAVMSRMPMRVIRESTLSNAVPGRRREARGAIWVQIVGPGGRTVHVLNTHFGLGAAEVRLHQETRQREAGTAACEPGAGRPL